MSDYSELKRLAEACIAAGEYLPGEAWEEDRRYCQAEVAFLEFVPVATPAAVQALIAESERLAADEQEAADLCDRLSDLLRNTAIEVRGPEEPKSRHGFHDLPSRVKTVVAERDQLKAENERQAAQFKEWQASHHANYCKVAEERDELRAEIAGLKTGYEAYERVNAELKAEVELLRSLLGQSALAATTLRTDAEAYANHSGFNRVFVDLIRSISGVEVGHGYGSSKYPQQADVVAALGQGEQS